MQLSLLQSSHQDSYLSHMAHDITGEFRTFVDQKRKSLGDSRWTKPGRQPHPVPGDTQMDGAPPFMHTYMKEAYTIVSHHRLSFCSIRFLRARSCNKLVP
jgi:hypothetical protein